MKPSKYEPNYHWQQREKHEREVIQWHKTTWKAKVTAARLADDIDETYAKHLMSMSPREAWKMRNDPLRTYKIDPTKWQGILRSAQQTRQAIITSREFLWQTQ